MRTCSESELVRRNMRTFLNCSSQHPTIKFRQQNPNWVDICRLSLLYKLLPAQRHFVMRCTMKLPCVIHKAASLQMRKYYPIKQITA